MAFDLAIDAIREVVKLAAPDYLDGIDWNEASLRLPLAEQEASPRSMRAFQVVDGPVVGLGDFVGPGYEIRQELQIVLRYLHDPRSSEWYDLRKMASTDAARIVERVCRPPVGDYATAGILDIRFVRHDLLAASQQQGCHDQRLTFEVLHYLSATTENIRSLSLRRFSTYTALRAHLVAMATSGQLARLVNGTTLERIADYQWNGSKAVMVGTADLTKVASTSYSATDIAAGSGGTVTLTYGTGVVVATAGATFTAAQESAFDVLHVGTHTAYGIPQQSTHWAGEHFSAGALPTAGTPGRLASVVAEATGVQSAAYRDTGAAWEQLYQPGDVPTVASVAAYNAATLYGEKVAYVTDQSRLYRAGPLAQYDAGAVPAWASTAAMEAGAAEGDYGTIGGVLYQIAGGVATPVCLVTRVTTMADGFALASPSDGDRFALAPASTVLGTWVYRTAFGAWVPDSPVDLAGAGVNGATIIGSPTVIAGTAPTWTAGGLASVSSLTPTHWYLPLTSAPVAWSAIRMATCGLTGSWTRVGAWDTYHSVMIGGFYNTGSIVLSAGVDSSANGVQRGVYIYGALSGVSAATGTTVTEAGLTTSTHLAVRRAATATPVTVSAAGAQTVTASLAAQTLASLGMNGNLIGIYFRLAHSNPASPTPYVTTTIASIDMGLTA